MKLQSDYKYTYKVLSFIHYLGNTKEITIENLAYCKYVRREMGIEVLDVKTFDELKNSIQALDLGLFLVELLS